MSIQKNAGGCFGLYICLTVLFHAAVVAHPLYSTRHVNYSFHVTSKHGGMAIGSRRLL
jgi:hypothetical protein